MTWRGERRTAVLIRETKRFLEWIRNGLRILLSIEGHVRMWFFSQWRVKVQISTTFSQIEDPPPSWRPGTETQTFRSYSKTRHLNQINDKEFKLAEVQHHTGNDPVLEWVQRDIRLSTNRKCVFCVSGLALKDLARDVYTVSRILFAWEVEIGFVICRELRRSHR